MQEKMKTDWIVKDEFKEHLKDFSWDRLLDSAFDTLMLMTFCVAYMDNFGKERYGERPLAHGHLCLMLGAYHRLFKHLVDVHEELEGCGSGNLAAKK